MGIVPADYPVTCYSITGYSRADMNHNKAKLYELGGLMPGLVNKWNEKK